MAQSRSGKLELRRADSGQDLWSAVEAAQYGRVVGHDTPGNDAEADCMQDLLGFFADCSEQWGGKSTVDQTLALQQLGSRLAALEELELHVYWAVVRGRFDTAEGQQVELPVAVLTIARNGQPTLTVDLPGEIDLG